MRMKHGSRYKITEMVNTEQPRGGRVVLERRGSASLGRFPEDLQRCVSVAWMLMWLWEGPSRGVVG